MRKHVRVAPVIPDTLYALDALSLLRDAEVPMALVHDEYGHFEGVVTPADALESIVGVFRSDSETPEPDAVRREDGSWLLAGSMPVTRWGDHRRVVPEGRSYHTVGGLVISELQHLPVEGEHVDAFGWQFGGHRSRRSADRQDPRLIAGPGPGRELRRPSPSVTSSPASAAAQVARGGIAAAETNLDFEDAGIPRRNDDPCLDERKAAPGYRRPE